MPGVRDENREKRFGGACLPEPKMPCQKRAVSGALCASSGYLRTGAKKLAPVQGRRAHHGCGGHFHFKKRRYRPAGAVWGKVGGEYRCGNSGEKKSAAFSISLGTRDTSCGGRNGAGP